MIEIDLKKVFSNSFEILAYFFAHII